jgi:hypothetical protein
MALPNVGVRLGYRFHYALVDGIDGVSAGRLNDSVWSLKSGIVFYPRLF